MLSIKSPLEHERRQAKASGDLSSPGHISGPPKLAPLERLPKRHRVGPSASLDEYRTINCAESVSQGKGHVNLWVGQWRLKTFPEVSCHLKALPS